MRDKESVVRAGNPDPAPLVSPLAGPAGGPGAGPAAGPVESGAGGGAPRRPGLVRGTTLLLVVVVLLAAAGALLYARTAQLRDSEAATNRALTDAAATQAALTAVSRVVETVFSYSYRDAAVTQRAAEDLLAGSAATEYERLFAQVTQHAAEQRLTLTSRVAAAGVTALRGERATVLVFLDQAYTYGDGRPAQTAAAQLAVTARHDASRWQIVEIESR
jgi:Mce-associated membrane protein